MAGKKALKRRIRNLEDTMDRVIDVSNKLVDGFTGQQNRMKGQQSRIDGMSRALSTVTHRQNCVLSHLTAGKGSQPLAFADSTGGSTIGQTGFPALVILEVTTNDGMLGLLKAFNQLTPGQPMQPQQVTPQTGQPWSPTVNQPAPSGITGGQQTPAAAGPTPQAIGQQAGGPASTPATAAAR